MYSCQQTLYTYGLMTLGFIYLPSVYVNAAFFGPSVSGILGFFWGIIFIAMGVGLNVMFSDLIPRLITLYFLLFGFFISFGMNNIVELTVMHLVRMLHN